MKLTGVKIKMSLDKIDIKIINSLQKDSSIPFIEIAKKVGVTDGTIHQRVKKLRKSGTLKNFTVILNHKQIGGGSLAYTSIKVNPGFLDSVSNQIKKISNVLEIQEIHNTQGDLLIKIRADSQEKIRDIVVEKIRKIVGIVDTDILPVFKSWKEEINLPVNATIIENPNNDKEI